MYLLKQITFPEFKGWFYSRYIPMICSYGIEYTRKDLKLNIWECQSFDVLGFCQHSKIIKPILSIDGFGTEMNDSIELSFEEYKIPMDEFERYEIDYSIITCETKEKTMQVMKYVWDGKSLKNMNNLFVCPPGTK